MEVDVIKDTETKPSLVDDELRAAQLHSEAREQRKIEIAAQEEAEAKRKIAQIGQHWRETEVVKTLRPGANGTKKFLQHYGESLVAVRYRRDNVRKRQLTTIELVIDDRDPPRPGIDRNRELGKQRQQLVSIKLDFDEIDLRSAVKRCGARWDREKKVWWLRREDVVALRLLDRVVAGFEKPDIDFV